MALFLAFVGVSIVVIVTPGPDTAVTIRNTLLGGRRSGVTTAFGIASGQALWAFATSVGLVGLLTASAPLFLALKYAGAAYLVYLGLSALRHALMREAPTSTVSRSPGGGRLTAIAAFRQGLISNLANPKMAVFFASLLPQFVPAGEAAFPALLALGLAFSALTFVWLTFYAVVIARFGNVLARPLVRRWFEGLTGTVLVALGVRVATQPS